MASLASSRCSSSPGELAAYLQSKLFNGIVFFGYTNGGTAAGAQYSFYTARPDVYQHQRWVFRRMILRSRAPCSGPVAWRIRAPGSPPARRAR